MLWELRANLIGKYGHAIGNPLALQLVTDAMKLCPLNPNFLQSRDAIIQADLVNRAGDDISELWAAFAKRGMGAGATSPVSTSTMEKGLSTAGSSHAGDRRVRTGCTRSTKRLSRSGARTPPSGD